MKFSQVTKVQQLMTKSMHGPIVNLLHITTAQRANTKTQPHKKDHKTTNRYEHKNESDCRANGRIFKSRTERARTRKEMSDVRYKSASGKSSDSVPVCDRPE